MRLSKKTKRLGWMIIAYTQLIADTVPDDALGKALKTRLGNIISPGKVEITVTPREDLASRTVKDVAAEIRDMVMAFKEGAKKPVPSLGTDKERFESSLRRALQDFDNIVETLDWYEDERKTAKKAGDGEL